MEGEGWELVQTSEVEPVLGSEAVFVFEVVVVVEVEVVIVMEVAMEVESLRSDLVQEWMEHLD